MVNRICRSCPSDRPSVRPKVRGGAVRCGCFLASFPLNKNSFCILFYLAQKGEYNKKIVLDKLVHLFGVGKVYKHSQNNNWFYRVNGLSNTKVLINYFYNSKFTFFTQKATSYLVWKQIHNSINHKEHLVPFGPWYKDKNWLVYLKLLIVIQS